MGVLINKKRCDNASVCPCIENCPTKAFYYDTKKNTVAVHNELCINCRKCMLICEAGAVKVFRNEEELLKLKTEYDEDAMTTEKLFQDRYGACLVDETFGLDLSNLDKLIIDSNKVLLIEFYNEDEASCLINSIPIKEIIEHIPKEVSYRKIEVKDVEIIKKYGIDSLPSLIIIEGQKNTLIQEGPILISSKEELFTKIDDLFLENVD